MTKLVLLLLAFTVGLFIGIGLAAFLFIRRGKKDAIGTLQIIEAEGEDPYLFLALDTDVKYFAHEPVVTMRVTHKWSSHK